jgi:ABC-type branched-subunit amino acid transport system substrate-binding protein
MRQPIALGAMLLALAASGLHAQTQGVTKTEVKVGTIQDLSGPLALYGKNIRNGLQMRLDEANEAGGVHGRKFRLLVEDSGYDPKKGSLAASKLVASEKVFAVVGTIGTPVMQATMPMILEKGVLHLFPLAAARESFEPLHPLKFAFFAPYYDAMRAAVKHMVRDKGYKRIGLMVQDDDFGNELAAGTEQGLKDIGMSAVERTTYKRGATDFASQIQRLRAANVDFIVLGTPLRETVGAMVEARKLGWNVDMMCSQASTTSVVARLGGKAVEGLYGTPQFPPNPANSQYQRWIEAYKKRFGPEFDTSAAAGYIAGDLFLRGVENAGPNLTAASFSAGMERVKTTRDFFETAGFEFSKSNHMGSRKVRMAQIRDGKWLEISDYLE